MSNTALQGKTVVIIGGSSGIGLATAQRVVADGANVVVLGRSTDALAKAKVVLGETAQTVPADITNEQSLKTAFETIGPFDHLVTTAANLHYAPVTEFDAADALEVITSKLLGPVLAVKHAAKHLSPEGSILFVSGVAAEKPMEGASLVAAVNGGLSALARTLAVELAPVRVNVVSPGVTDTPSWNGMEEKSKREFFASLGSQLPSRRIGRPSDLADAIVFVLGNGFVTGETLVVDGGHRWI